jgi:acetyl esterase/lipase
MAKAFPRVSFNRWNVRLFNGLIRLQPKPKLPPGIQTTELAIPGHDQSHDIRLCVYRPGEQGNQAPALLWMHGGGMVIGRADMNAAQVTGLVQELGLVIISVDYRLAPAHAFPTALHDCYQALKWISANARLLGIDPDCIAIGGESAGGGLAASLAQLTHDTGEVRPVFQLLIYPMLDDRSALRADLSDVETLAWTPQSNRFAWESYLDQACGSETLPPYAVPARRADLSGLPPAWIGVGTLDLFHDEAIAYAQRLKSDGVDCELVVVPGAFHGFDQFDHELAVVRAFRRSQIEALRKHCRGPRPARPHPQ